mgnify:CR=1 FL=1
MKTHHILIVLFFILITFGACREISVTTTVNKDGSFTRMIKITGDSADVFRKDLPYPIDDSWLMEVKHDSADTSIYVTYTKTYSNSDLLNIEMKNDTGWMSQLDRSVDIKKRFGFFYSYLTFNEVIKAANPFTALDYKDFLSPEDLQWINNERLPKTTSDTTNMDKADEKALEFIAESYTEELVQIIEAAIKKLNDPSVNPQIIQTHYDSIYKKVTEGEFETAEVFIDYLAEWSGIQNILKIKTAEPDFFTEFDEKLQFFNKIFEMENYQQFVEMPGLITETNSLILKGNSVSWKVQNLYFLFSDYKMHVESRVVNYWMFALTGFLVLMLIIFLVIKAVQVTKE